MAVTQQDRSRGSESVTEGVRVQVRPRFMPGQSDPSQDRYIFTYQVRITNEGEAPARLLRRRWEIVDADGGRRVVDDEGVIGQQPDIRPGETFDYSSYCDLGTPWGTMEGWYTMARPGGAEFRATIARFYLAAPESARG
ncbi:MAG: Co2+/Mg2+ efflux protein ApaG [Phycisphaerales bacterium]|nr:Co2+/Mg2+ efflux protein ApaG [Phycisphaerales bacterium]